MINNYMKLEVPSFPDNSGFVCIAVEEFVKQLQPTRDELWAIRICVEEAIINCMAHAYPESTGTILVKCNILKPKSVKITVKDTGKGIKNVEKALTPYFTTRGYEHVGVGFDIIKTYMDSFHVKSTYGKGTSIDMKKHIGFGY